MKKFLAAKKIVESCESSDASGLMKGVENALLEKVVSRVDKMKTTLGKKFFSENTVISTIVEHKPKDLYESQEFTMQEAIDYVVESVLSDSGTYEESISEAAEKFEVEKEKLKEYFDSMVAEEPKEDQIDSDDDDKNGPNMNDMDADKRTRFESRFQSGAAILENGEVVTISKADSNMLSNVFQELTEENKEKLVSTLFESSESFDKILKFSRRVSK